jgi:hypothetical protein
MRTFIFESRFENKKGRKSRIGNRESNYFTINDSRLAVFGRREIRIAVPEP